MSSRKLRRARAPEVAITPQQFLEGLYLLAPGERMPDGVYGWTANFSNVIDDAPAGIWRGQSWSGGDPLSIKGFGRGTYDGQNTYAVISAFRPESDGTMGRRKHLYEAGFAVMLDDLGTKVPMERGLVLPPSYLVETSPGNFQSWLFLDEPIMERERHEALLDALVRSGLSIDGTDPGMRGVTRYGRMPFGVNTKRKHGGFPVRLVEWRPERRYSVEEIVGAYNLALAPPRRRVLGPPPSDAALDAATREFSILLRILDRLGLYKREKRDGWHEITCPWADEHSDGRDDGAALSAPTDANGWRGGYRCHHGHCERRGIAEVRAEVQERLLALAGGAK